MIDQVTLNFNQSSLWILNIALAFIMFGIALDLKLERFRVVLKNPRSLVIGLTAQLILLPFFTYLIVLFIEPIPSMALGMMLVASCPGGNISNFISALSKANVELSIVMTTITSLLAVFLTPLNFNLYGTLYAPTNEIIQSISLSWLEVGKAIGMIIIAPIIIGRLVSIYMPNLAQKLTIPLRNISMVLFLGIVVAALVSNGTYFLEYISEVFGLVLLHNGMALGVAFLMALLFKVSLADRKSITIETGIQNSGLGLLLIFGFFEGLGGMAIIAAWWGIWHIITGFLISWLFNRKN